MPTPEELDHDYLWRVHQRVPAKGELVIFNRSHFEDVLITRVEGWIDDRTAKRRFCQINDFEAMLVEEGTIIPDCPLGAPLVAALIAALHKAAKSLC